MAQSLYWCGSLEESPLVGLDREASIASPALVAGLLSVQADSAKAPMAGFCPLREMLWIRVLWVRQNIASHRACPGGCQGSFTWLVRSATHPIASNNAE